MKPKSLSLLLICGVLFFIIANCNIFDWTTVAEDEVFYDGLKLFNQQKFTEAKEKFAEAMESDPTRSDYRYYHAKATVFASNLNLFQVVRQIIKIDTTTVTNLKLPLYTRESDMTIEQDNVYKNNLYQVVWVSHDDITPIYFEETHGEIQADDIYFEFSIMSLARAILQLRDTNNDKLIDNNDIYFGITKFCNPQTGECYYLPTLNDDKVIDFLGVDENRRGFNEMLINSATYTAEGLTSINYVFGDTTLFNNDDLENLIENIEDMSNFYQIGDRIDNDGDGSIDEEAINGLDDDGDGRIDEDAHL